MKKILENPLLFIQRLYQRHPLNLTFHFSSLCLSDSCLNVHMDRFHYFRDTNKDTPYYVIALQICSKVATYLCT